MVGFSGNFCMLDSLNCALGCVGTCLRKTIGDDWFCSSVSCDLGGGAFAVGSSISELRIW